ncbi:unnamed protein product [Acanthoscelides obtectus]|uniref:DDE Tnp4 domain-containing protein n=1 Tax=Acanthoscelides obtectus TaxID=200917 RepID=A0A9P0Q3F5_ACAOB|nr:unnamed protein product [Acanthoscelides obtectus]CAK1625108.1 Putative nuclease HARBI1 [Acanthoscelides obtectus]
MTFFNCRISKCGDDAEVFRNRKGYFSLNVQTVSDAKLKILNIVCRWPGSTHDSAIFQNSRLCYQFETGVHAAGLLLGDNGYPLKVRYMIYIINNILVTQPLNYLMTPFLSPQTSASKIIIGHILQQEIQWNDNMEC